MSFKQKRPDMSLQVQTPRQEEEKMDGLNAARVAAPGGGVLDATKKSLEEMQEYVKTSGCAKTLQELYEKLVVNQPEDPIAFLIQELKKKRGVKG